MIPVFFINLDQHKDRRQFIESQLAAAGFHAERIAGIDGDNLPEFLSSYFPRSSLSPGEIGCYASHLLVWRTVVERDLPHALVLEDDVQIENDAADLVDELLRVLPQGWDYVHMDGRPRSRGFAARPLGELTGKRKLIRFSRIPDGTVAYLISNQGARKLLAPTVRLAPVDTAIRRPWQWGLDLYGVTNPPFRPAEFPSTIETRGSRSRRQHKRWLGSGFRSFHSFAFNIRKLGPYWWVRCFVENALNKARRNGLKSWSNSPSDTNHFYRNR
jgi:glycosyl transferase family 25